MREYDFSRLVKPLHECCRAYTARRFSHGLCEVIVIQSEDMSPPDQLVYVIGDPREAQQAAIEIDKMITAAKALVKGST